MNVDRNRVLFISKPVAPPWNDSSKNLVRDISCALTAFEATVLTKPGTAGQGVAWQPERGSSRATYSRSRSGFSPGLLQNAQVARLLALGRNLPHIWNFFFAPNPKSSFVARALSRLRRARTVQTVCSQPRVWDAGDFFGDAVVALSKVTYERLAPEAGGLLNDTPCYRIPPCVPVREPRSPADRARIRQKLGLTNSEPVFIYPGDIEFGGGASLVLEAFERFNGAQLVMACRNKTERAQGERASLQHRFSSMADSGRLKWVGETELILEYLGASDVLLLPSADLYGKMDIPLVLLEGMMQARPVVVHERAAASELCEAGGLCTSDSADDLAQTLQKLAEDAPWREQLGQQLRSHALEHHAPTVVARQYEKIYRELHELA